MPQLTRLPTTGTSDSGNGGDVGWSNPIRVTASDNSEAQVNLAPGATTFWLRAGGFDFTAIPDTATIDNINVRVECHTNGTVVDVDCRLDAPAFGGPGTNQPAAGTWPLAADTYLDHSHTAVQWGGPLTGSDLKHPDFAVLVSALNAGGSNAGTRIDSIELVVDYTEAGGTAVTINVAAGQVGTAGQPAVKAGPDVVVAVAVGAATAQGQPAAKAGPDVTASLSIGAVSVPGQAVVINPNTAGTNGTGTAVTITLSPGQTGTAGQSVGINPNATGVAVAVTTRTLSVQGRPLSVKSGAPVTVIVGSGAAHTAPQSAKIGPVSAFPLQVGQVSMMGRPPIVRRVGDDVLVGAPTPLTIDLNSINQVNDTNATISHAITTSSSPGAAPAILATDSQGQLHLARLAADQVESSLLPGLTDAYDLGSPVRLWRKGWLSEMDAVLFAANTASLIGGWFIIPKQAGTLAADVAAADTQVDFGTAVTPGDVVLIRAALAVEYMQVGALVGGTTYTVTRNLDGTGANDWPAGTPFAVLGTAGDGRIELDAQSGGPRITILEQGAAYNGQTERVRLGDLTGWGSLAGYGIAIGDPAGDRLTYDPANGLVIAGDGGGMTNIDGGNIQAGTITAVQLAANSVTATEINVSTLSAISANLGTITAGDISGTTITVGNNDVTLDGNGIGLTDGTGVSNRISWNSGYIQNNNNAMTLYTWNEITLQLQQSPTTNLIRLTNGETMILNSLSVGTPAAPAVNGLSVQGDVNFEADLNVMGNIQRGGTTGHIYVPFRSGPVQPTGWAGAVKTAGTYYLTAASMAGVPTNAVALAMQIGITGGTAGQNMAVGYAGYVDAIFAQIQTGMTQAFAAGVTNFDTSGQIRVTVSAPLTCYIRVIGYYI